MFQLLGYFAERMISKETLQRNYVMQVADGKVRKYFYPLLSPSQITNSSKSSKFFGSNIWIGNRITAFLLSFLGDGNSYFMFDDVKKTSPLYF